MIRTRTLIRMRERLESLLEDEIDHWWSDLPPKISARRRHLQALLKHGESSTPSLAETLGCSIRSVFRDMQWLKDYTARFDDGRERYRLIREVNRDFNGVIDNYKNEMASSIGKPRAYNRCLVETIAAIKQKFTFMIDAGLLENTKTETPDFEKMTVDELRRYDAKLAWKQAKVEQELDEIDWIAS